MPNADADSKVSRLNSLLQAHDSLFSHPIPQETRTVPVATVELHVRASVREADNGVGIVEDLCYGIFVHVVVALYEDRIQFLFYRQV